MTAMTDVQLQALVEGDWLTTGPLRLNQGLSREDLKRAVILQNVRRWLEDVIRRGPLAVNARGELSAAAIDRLFGVLHFGGQYIQETRAEFGDDLHERDVRPLRITRVLLERLGMLERRGEALYATRKAEELTGPGRAGELFARLFRGYFRDFDHSFTDPEDPAPEVHRHAGYSLWVIANVCDDWTRSEDLLPLLLPPAVTEAESVRLKGLSEAARNARPREPLVPSPQELLMFRFLEILPDYGIVQRRESNEPTPFPHCRKTSLFDRFITFDWGAEQPTFARPVARGRIRLER